MEWQYDKKFRKYNLNLSDGRITISSYKQGFLISCEYTKSNNRIEELLLYDAKNDEIKTGKLVEKSRRKDNRLNRLLKINADEILSLPGLGRFKHIGLIKILFDKLEN